MPFHKIIISPFSYERRREAAGEAFYPDSGTLIHGTHKDSKDAIDRMAQDVQKQVRYIQHYLRRNQNHGRSMDDEIRKASDSSISFHFRLRSVRSSAGGACTTPMRTSTTSTSATRTSTRSSSGSTTATPRTSATTSREEPPSRSRVGDTRSYIRYLFTMTLQDMSYSSFSLHIV